MHGQDLTFGIGPAGTGKTYLAVACAVEALESDRVRRIVLVRPAVEAGERLGFLPGDLAQKVDPYLRPIYDALYEMLGFDRVAALIERNVIEVAPLAFMRGRTLNESFVILDEAQNTTPEQMKMFLTRIGFGSRAVVTGDITQTRPAASASSPACATRWECCEAWMACASPISTPATWCAIRWCSASSRPTKRGMPRAVTPRGARRERGLPRAPRAHAPRRAPDGALGRRRAGAARAGCEMASCRCVVGSRASRS